MVLFPKRLFALVTVLLLAPAFVQSERLAKLINSGADPGFGSGGNIFLSVSTDEVQWSNVNKVSSIRLGSRACIRAPEALSLLFHC